MLPVFFLLLFLGDPKSASATVELQTCIHPHLVERKGRDSCWVSLPSTQAMLCIPRAQWREWLKHPNSSSACEKLKGNWKIFSSPDNSDHPHKKIRHSFKIENLNSVPFSASLLWKLWLHIERWREDLSTLLSSHDSCGIFRQLLLNEKIPHSPGNTLRLLGLVHLLTVTGIHLYAVSHLWGQFLLKISQVLDIPYRLASPLSRAFSGITWLIAWLLCGGRLGMLRPLVIVILRSLARFLGFRWRVWSPLLLSISLDLGIAILRKDLSPESLSARILYALAVGGGMLGKGGHFQLAVNSWIFAALWDAWNENLIAPLTPILSFLTIPIFAGVIYPLLLFESLRSISLSLHSNQVLNTVLTWTHVFLNKLTTIVLNHSPFPALWHLPQSSLILGIAFATFLRALGNLRRLEIWTLITLFIWRLIFQNTQAENSSAHQSLRAVQIEQIDVGQGDATLILDTEGHAGLIDTGPYQALNDATWIRFFLHRGITKLDWVGLTHLDQDHAGGIRQLANLIPIRCAATAQEQIQSSRGQDLRQFLLKQEIDLETLPNHCIPFPSLPPSTPESSKHPNSNMTAFFIPLAQQGFYLSLGDANAEDSEKMGDWARKLSSLSESPRILKIAHHGSRSSDSRRLLELLRPTEAWISVGVGNSYGHPSIQVLQDLEIHGIFIRRTDRDGLLRWPQIH